MDGVKLGLHGGCSVTQLLYDPGNLEQVHDQPTSPERGHYADSEWNTGHQANALFMTLGTRDDIPQPRILGNIFWGCHCRAASS